MEIKNLAQLKRVLGNIGAKFEIVDHWRTDSIGERRVVQHVQTNAICSGIDGDPEHKISKANYGRGYYLYYGKASEWKFEDGLCKWRPEHKSIPGHTYFTIRVLEN